MGSLSASQLEHYEAHGYVVVPGVLDPPEIERYLARARQIAHGDHPADAAKRVIRDIQFAKGTRPMPEDPELALWKFINPDRFDSVMAECLRFPRVLDAVESIVGEDLLAFLLMFIYKPPGLEDSIHPFHQDGAYFPFGPHDRVVGVWIPLDPVNEKNGGLCVVPGSHKFPISPHEVLPGVNAGAFQAEIARDERFAKESIAFELPPGDAVVFHPRLLHRTGGNHTQSHRRVVTLHIASAQCQGTRQEPMREYGFTLVRGRTYDGCLQPTATEARTLG